MDMKKILIVDVEATCWERTEKFPGVNEVIEFGITTLDLETMKGENSVGLLVRPTTSQVSSFCTKLTTLTPEMVAVAPGFKEVCAEIIQKHRSDHHPWASWGDYDRNQVERQCRRDHVDNPFKGRHLNLKLLFALAFKLNKEIGMDAALKLTGIPLEGQHHRGVDDARNIAKLAGLLFLKLRA